MHSLMLSAGVLFTALYAILILFLLAMTAH